MAHGCVSRAAVTVNIGSDLEGFDLPNARLVSVFASLGLVGNIQVTSVHTGRYDILPTP